MKRQIALILLAAMLIFSLASCGENYDSLTAEFYGTINSDSFWYKAKITQNGTSYYYSQATNGKSVTTIEDYENDSDDVYAIYVGNSLHSLNFKNKEYNTTVTEKGVGFIFSNNEASNFNRPSSEQTETLNGISYYCETFETVDSQGNASGENKYFFDNGRLVAIQWVEYGTVVRTMEFEDYSEEIPSDIYLSVPEGFTAGTLTYTEDVDVSELIG